MDSCRNTDAATSDFLRKFHRKIAAQRIPYSGMISLTHRCNLHCVHCYLGDENGAIGARDELDTAAWMALIDDIVDAGCLFLTLTGGEPLIRNDFPDIYRHAKEQGLLVTVFSNATLISEEIISLFKDLPPRNIDVTLYGATPETYDRITSIPGSFRRCIRGIEALLVHRLPLSLKTVLMSLNRQEVSAIRKMANAYGVEFRYDPSIMPCLTGKKEPLELRVAPEEVAAMEFSELEMGEQFRDFFEKSKSLASSQKLYNCATGQTSFYVDSYGNLQPCLMVSSPAYDLTRGDFSTGWTTVIPNIRERHAGPHYICNDCEKRGLCGLCPGLFQLESGRADIRSEYLCALGEHRYSKIAEHSH
ncbi:hypothetical protein D3OALGA1CA_3503 [Olavius algarvensis associated proteobacterium Delta 3]|nr:hypothetical protein D3OALGA1CA_3503 [Olavius algarvensis associated proteobacterium Delta 3]